MRIVNLDFHQTLCGKCFCITTNLARMREPVMIAPDFGTAQLVFIKMLIEFMYITDKQFMLRHQPWANSLSAYLSAHSDKSEENAVWNWLESKGAKNIMPRLLAEWYKSNRDVSVHRGEEACMFADTLPILNGMSVWYQGRNFLKFHSNADIFIAENK